MSHDIDAPSQWVTRFASLIRPGGTVLDVACGGGRHTRWLLAHGFHVVAVDRTPGLLAALAAQAPLHVSGAASGALETVCADIEGAPWPFADRLFDGLVVTNYLHRPLFPVLRDAMPPEGVLIYETFAQGNERYGRPSNPDFLLRPEELLRETEGLQVVAFEQGLSSHPRPTVIQRICAVRSPEPKPLQ